MNYITYKLIITNKTQTKVIKTENRVGDIILISYPNLISSEMLTDDYVAMSVIENLSIGAHFYLSDKFEITLISTEEDLQMELQNCKENWRNVNFIISDYQKMGEE